jgi:hypothetical protein
MHEALVPMFFPALGAHVSGSEFMYPDQSWKELCGQMANLVAESGGNKGQLSHLVEAICRDFRLHDDAELKKLVEWQQLVKTKSANKDKPARPDVAFWFPPSDVTNPAFIQNAMALEKQDGRTQYINMPEVEMADRMCGGHKQVSQMIRNIYDRQRAGALRATADGVTGNPLLRCNLSISSTPIATRLFYKNDLFNGTFGVWLSVTSHVQAVTDAYPDKVSTRTSSTRSWTNTLLASGLARDASSFVRSTN